jgi:hypothetical protein
MSAPTFRTADDFFYLLSDFLRQITSTPMYLFPELPHSLVAFGDVSRRNIQ